MLRADPPVRRTVTDTSVVALRRGATHQRADRLTTEEPMEAGRRLGTTVGFVRGGGLNLSTHPDRVELES